MRAQTRAAGVTWELDRQGRNHEVYRIGPTMTPDTLVGPGAPILWCVRATFG